MLRITYRTQSGRISRVHEVLHIAAIDTDTGETVSVPQPPSFTNNAEWGTLDVENSAINLIDYNLFDYVIEEDQLTLDPIPTEE